MDPEINSLGDEDFLSFTLERSTLVDDLVLEWEFSETLEETSWQPIDPDTIEITPLGDDEERIEIDFLLQHPKGFFRPILRQQP